MMINQEISMRSKKIFEIDDLYQVSNIEYLQKNLSDLRISSIKLKDIEFDIINKRMYKLFYTNNKNPIVLYTNPDTEKITIYINRKWYKKNKNIVENFINYIAKNSLENELEIEDKCFITDELVDSICENVNLKKVSFYSYSDNRYKLDKKNYLKFKKAGIVVSTNGVEDNLKEVYDFIIDYNNNKNLINYYNYNDLQNLKFLSINKKLKKEELNNLKYLGNLVQIKLYSDAYESLPEILQYLKAYNKNNKILLSNSDKKILNEFLFSNKINDDSNLVFIDNINLSINEYIKLEKILYEMISHAKDLSPFERYIYAYNVTKLFKEYKESKNNKQDSRNLYNILMNEYIVCVGFSNLFGDLLEKLDISSASLSVKVDTSYDDEYVIEDQNKQNEILVTKIGHQRRYVYLKDPKYNIDGFYISDPTWDNNLENDYYNHLVLTNKESISSDNYLWFDTQGISELFNINSIDEFYKKLNFLLDIKEPSFLKNLSYRINDIIELIKQIDVDYIKKISKKYDYLDKHYLNWPEDITDLIYDLGKYIVSHVNKSISGDTIMSAVEQVYRHSYGYSEDMLQQKLIEIIKSNKERQDNVFPKRYKEYLDGRKEVYENETNKFDLEKKSNKTL